MKTNKLKVGQIIVVINGSRFGNKKNTITKIFSRTDNPEVVICEGWDLIHSEMIPSGWKYVHTRKKFEKHDKRLFWYEDINDLRPATEKEKEVYRKQVCNWKLKLNNSHT